MYFQITLVSQRHSSVLVNKHCAFYVNELSIGPGPSARPVHVLHTGRVGVVTGLPFDQMEHGSGNPVRIPKLERDFPDFWMEIYAGFYERVNDRLMKNSYKQYIASSGVYFGPLFHTLNHQGPYNSKMNRY